MEKFYPVARQVRCYLHAWLAAAVISVLLMSPLTAQKALAADFVIDTSSTALSGLWYKQSESGWGVSLTQQGPIIFAAWYAYESNGMPVWYVLPRCEIVANGCTGDIYRVTGGTKPTIAWAGANRIVSKVGSGAITFTDLNTGVFGYLLNGVSASRSITRQLFATGTMAPAMDYTGLWWNASESGWGMSITQQFATIFAAWFTYDDAGAPVWYTASNCVITGNSCSGDLYYVSGGTPPTLAWNVAGRTVTRIGAIRIDFASINAAAISYTISGVSGSRLITRQIFYTAPTIASAPIIGTAASASSTSAAIAFSAPISNGGSVITSYTVACSAAGSVFQATGSSSPITITGLTAGTAYSCIVTAVNAVGVSAGSGSVSVTPGAMVAPGVSTFKGQVWADNWFALYVGDTKIAEDSVPVTTERSFNSETFNFSARYPLELSFILKDYKQDDSGLEYIGLANQQIGDGGFIMQITDTAANKVVSVSSSAFKCLVIHQAPLNPSCERDLNPLATCQSRIIAEPVGWKSADYSVSTWENASVYTTTQIGVKEGYFDIAWNAAAKLIWTADLKADNTLLCKATVSAPTTATIPAAPTGLVATASTSSVNIAFTASVTSDGLPVSSYTATCVNGASTLAASNIASPIVVIGLASGLLYTCTVAANGSAGSSAQSASVAVTALANTTPTGGFKVVSSAGVEGGALSSDYTCDGAGSSAALTWTNPPVGTAEFAVLMTTLPGDGTTKWNWVLYNIPASRTGLVKDSFGMGTLGVGSDGPNVAYQPPCSQGAGSKLYTYTVYALSAAPNVTGIVTGAALTEAMAGITLGTARLNLNVTRTSMTGSGANCLNVRNSTNASTTGRASVGCDSSYAYVGSNGLATHAMMNGITASNLQMPLANNFFGANAWKIPLNPAIAASTTTAVDGPIGVAINGVPIFNPCKQGGCQNGDTKVLGELDSCNGHAGRADDYHYHAAPTCLMAGKPTNYWDTHPLGWALDGFAIFGYNDANGVIATRDGVCGGNTSAVSNGPAGYSYHVTDASPYVLSCFRGTPSPDLTGQGGKYFPIRLPPVTPFAVSNMTLSTDSADGYQVLQFSTARAFVSTATGTDSYNNAAGTYKIRYKQLTGTALIALLAQGQNSNKSTCWNFQFLSSAGATTQPSISYCR
jgi:phosphatidylethanolamine-binding protein (PEBP) family uncharacterized protein